MKCNDCTNNNETYCPGDGQGYMIDTYNCRWPDGSIAQGGYSNAIRAHKQFVFGIPDAIKSEHAAPMLCAGLTVYSPLVRNQVGPGSRVAVVGIGGLGHFAVMFARALGAHVVAISHTPSKKEEVLAMGANEFISTHDNPGWAKSARLQPFDLILNTACSAFLDFKAIVSCLKVNARLIFLGLPKDEIKLPLMELCNRGASIGSSHIGTKAEAVSMLKLAAEKQIRPWIEVLPMNDCARAIERISKGDGRCFISQIKLTLSEVPLCA